MTIWKKKKNWVERGKAGRKETDMNGPSERSGHWRILGGSVYVFFFRWEARMVWISMISVQGHIHRGAPMDPSSDLETIWLCLIISEKGTNFSRGNLRKMLDPAFPLCMQCASTDNPPSTPPPAASTNNNPTLQLLVTVYYGRVKLTSLYAPIDIEGGRGDREVYHCNNYTERDL